MDETKRTGHTVRLGPREYQVAMEMATEHALPNAEMFTRMSVMAVTALTNAGKLGLAVQLHGPNGKRYLYALDEPKVAYEIDARGQLTGQKLNLVVGFSVGKSKQHLKPIDGGKR